MPFESGDRFANRTRAGPVAGPSALESCCVGWPPASTFASRPASLSDPPSPPDTGLDVPDELHAVARPNVAATIAAAETKPFRMESSRAHGRARATTCEKEAT